MVPWVITREAQDGEPLVDALHARGIAAVCVPAIERMPLPWPSALSPLHTDVFFLTSPYAARLALERIDRTRPPVVAALAPATAAVVTHAGLEVTVTSPGGAVGLARALLEQLPDHPGRVLYPTSDAGLAQAEQEDAVNLLVPSFHVVREPVYRTRPAPGLAQRWRGLPAPVRAVVFSPSAARAIADVVAAEQRAPSHVVAVGASTARALPFPCTLAPPGADLVEFLITLQEPA